MTIVHKFPDKVKDGDNHAKRLDMYFAHWYYVIPMPLHIDKLGADRVFIEKQKPAHVHTVEYKSDEQTARTNNFFVEVVSVDADKKPGWAYTSIAHWLVYYLPQKDAAYIVRMDEIRKRIDAWRKQFKTAPAQNETYKTWGVLVPKREFEPLCRVRYLGDDKGAA